MYIGIIEFNSKNVISKLSDIVNMLKSNVEDAYILTNSKYIERCMKEFIRCNLCDINDVIINSSVLILFFNDCRIFVDVVNKIHSLGKSWIVLDNDHIVIVQMRGSSDINHIFPTMNNECKEYISKILNPPQGV